LGEINPYDLPWPDSGRLAGIDFGTVRIGVSLCDPSRTWTSPLETFQRKAQAIEVKHFQQLTRENQIAGWVVGLPLHCDGRDSSKAREVRDFSKWLISTTARPVRFIDERFTTALATRLLRELNLTHKQRKKQLDKIAAHIILDAYLESSKHSRYLGRRIAIPMSYHGIPWLNRPERIQEENPEEMLEQLEVQPGMTVCDMGCGDGYYTMELAKRVGPTGKVIAVDIQPEMLQELSRRCERNNLKNVEMILGLPHDPKLPTGKIDLILMVDVYHEFSNPVEMLTSMRESLKPNGRIALVEFRGEDPQVPIKPEHKMTKKQILKEYQANKMGVVKEYDRLPWQHLMFMGAETQEKSPKQQKPE